MLARTPPVRSYADSLELFQPWLTWTDSNSGGLVPGSAGWHLTPNAKLCCRTSCWTTSEVRKIVNSHFWWQKGRWFKLKYHSDQKQRAHHSVCGGLAVSENNHIFFSVCMFKSTQFHLHETNEAFFGYFGRRIIWLLVAWLLSWWLDSSLPVANRGECRCFFPPVLSGFFRAALWRFPHHPPLTPRSAAGLHFARANLRHWKHGCVMFLQRLALAGGSLRTVRSACQARLRPH